MPAVAAAAAKASSTCIKPGGIPAEMRVPFVVGVAVSALSGALAIGFLMSYLRTRGLCSLFIIELFLA